ncbi:MAG: hypothetical protein IJ080_07145 [Oscillospiraceae bacterium]|nr:hypothetical protein [Oscillospiraceae bacterium]MBQ8979516.1 hypothetical protein [Oscillospiraceae bacterium]
MELWIKDGEYLPLKSGIISAEASFAPRAVIRRRIGGDVTVIQSEMTVIRIVLRQVSDAGIRKLVQTALDGGRAEYKLSAEGRIFMGDGAVMIERIYSSLAGTEMEISIRS